MSNKVFKNVSVAFDYNGIEVQSKKKNKKKKKNIVFREFHMQKFVSKRLGPARKYFSCENA